MLTLCNLLLIFVHLQLGWCQPKSAQQFGYVSALASNGSIYYLPGLFGLWSNKGLMGPLSLLRISPTDACEPFESDQHERFSQSIILIPRGNCSFETKVANVANAGAIGAIIHNLSPLNATLSKKPFADYSSPPASLSCFHGLIRMVADSIGNFSELAEPSSYNELGRMIPSLFISWKSAAALLDIMANSNNLMVVTALVVLDYRKSTGGDFQYKEDANMGFMMADSDEASARYHQLIYFLISSAFILLPLILYRMLVQWRLDAIMQQMEQEKLLRSAISIKDLKTLASRPLDHRDIESTPLCPICLDDLHLGCATRILPCNHLYHESCIDNWLVKRSKLCPSCRQSVMTTTRQVEKVGPQYDGVSLSDLIEIGCHE